MWRFALAAMVLGCSGEEPLEFSVLTPEMAIAPAEVEFGDVGVLLSGLQSVYISNAGRRDLNVSLNLQDSNNIFALLSDTEFVVEPDSTAEVQLAFSPDNFLDFEATLVVTSDDVELPTVEIPVTGKGVALPSPDIDIPVQTVDFGEATVGQPEIMYTEIRNVGDAPLSLGSITQQGAGTFNMVFDPSNTTVAPNDSATVIIQYEPIFGDGDSGSLLIPSNDPDEPELVIQLLGNGGGDFEYPVAVVDCPEDVMIAGQLVWQEFDGSQSYDPAGYSLQYSWEVSSAPEGSSYELINGVTDTANVKMDIGGTYEVSLRVLNEIGTPSVPAKCSVQAIPADDLHVELTWDTPAADMDLHLWQDGYGFFSDPEDTNWCNASPDWGESGTDDNPRLDIDDLGGYGPENINTLSPADGGYYVGVHYFRENGDGAVVARVKVWLSGDLVWEGTQVLEDNETWTVGRVNWPDSTFAPSSIAVASAGFNRGCD